MSGKYSSFQGGESFLINFLGLEGKGRFDVYNPTAPVWMPVGGEIKKIILARVEIPEVMGNSRVIIFEEKEADVYKVLKGAPWFTGEDPSITIINDQVWISLVLVYGHHPRSDMWDFETVFYKGSDIMSLKRDQLTLEGKDNRLVEIEPGFVAGTSRPIMDMEDGRTEKTISYFELPIGDLSQKNIADQQSIFYGMFPDGWGGANELHNLTDRNQIGVIGHDAREEDCLVYDAISFVIDRSEYAPGKPMNPPTKTVLAIISDFPDIGPKLLRTKKVVFSGGVSFYPEEVQFTAGIGDSRVGVKIIDDPGVKGWYPQ